jgi:peroxiredoxin family protein
MAGETPRHIAFICSKGDLDMAYPALVMGWAALGNGVEVSLFFTFWGLDLITERRIDGLQLAPVANTSMKLTMMMPAPKNWGIPNLMGIMPGMTRFATWMMRRKIKAVGAPPVREYLQLLLDGGAKLYACKMTCDMMGLGRGDFIDGVIDGVTAADFVDLTEGAQLLFI